MKKRILAIVLAFALISALALTGCGTTAAPAAGNTDAAPAAEAKAEPVVLKLSHSLAESLPAHQAFLNFASNDEEKTNGAVKVDVYANAQLGDEREVFEGMQLGTVDFAYVSTGVVANFVNDFHLFDAPFLFADTDSAFAVCDSEIGQQLADELESTQNVKLIGYMDVGGRNIFSTKPIKSSDDLKGRKIRVMENDLHIALFNTLGAQATPMAFSELYTALQQGTVDAGENALQGIVSSGFGEICKNIAITNHIYAINIFGMGVKTLDKIPEEYRQIVLDEAWNCVLEEREMIAEANASAVDALVNDYGCEVVTIDHDALVEAVQPVYEQFKDTLPQDLITAAQEYLASK